MDNSDMILKLQKFKSLTFTSDLFFKFVIFYLTETGYSCLTFKFCTSMKASAHIGV